MSAPVYSLPTTGISPKHITKEDHEAAVQSVVNALYSEITGIASGLQPVGSWDASSGSFPDNSVIGHFYLVNAAGSVDGEAFVLGDWLIPLVNNASTSTFQSNWTRGDYGSVVPFVYNNAEAVVASLAPSRGEGALWQTKDGKNYIEAATGATDHDAITAGGVKLYEQTAKFGGTQQIFEGQGGNNLVVQQEAADSTSRFYVMPNGDSAEGVKGKIAVFGTDYEEDAANYINMRWAYVDDPSYPSFGTGQFNFDAKVVGSYGSGVDHPDITFSFNHGTSSRHAARFVFDYNGGSPKTGFLVGSNHNWQGEQFQIFGFGENKASMLLTDYSSVDGDTAEILFKVTGNHNATHKKGGLFFEKTDTNGRGKMHLALQGSNSSTNVAKTDAKITATHDGKVGVNTNDPTVALDVSGNAMRLRSPGSNPAASNDPGEVGTILWSADYIYVCVAADTWKRAALSSW